MPSTFERRFEELVSEEPRTQKELAKILKVSEGMIVHWAKGTRPAKAKHLLRMHDHWGVSVDYLLGVTDERTGLTPGANAGPESYPRPREGSTMAAESAEGRREDDMRAIREMLDVVRRAADKLELLDPMARSLEVLEGLVKVGVIRAVQPEGGPAAAMPPAEEREASGKNQHS